MTKALFTLIIGMTAISCTACSDSNTPEIPDTPVGVEGAVVFNKNKVLRTFETNPSGMNLNYFVDDDKNLNPTHPLAESLKKMGVKYLRYPGGDKSDNNLFAEYPYTKVSPGLTRHGKGTSMGREWFLNEQEDDFRFDPLDFDEFMALCREVGAEPIVVVPCDSRNAYLYRDNPAKAATVTRNLSAQELEEHAAAWVKYANVTKDYHVKYWMLGNESWHTGVQWAEGGRYTVDDYAEDIRNFSKAMKAVDPSILIIPNTSCETEDFTKALFSKAKGYFDMLCISNYPARFKNGYTDYVNRKHDVLFPYTGVIEEIKAYAPAGQKDMPVIVAEYGSYDWWEGWGFGGDMGHALCDHEMFGRMLEEPQFAFGCFWTTRWYYENMPGSGWAEFNCLDNNNNLRISGEMLAFWGQYLYADIIEVESGVKQVIAFASSDKTSGNVYLHLLNQNGIATEVTLKSQSGNISEVTQVGTMYGKSDTDREPVISHHSVKSGEKVSLKPYSLTVLRVK